MRKILIAGCGHGGLVAGSYLSEKGYDVSIYEAQKREDLGYNWGDTIELNALDYASIKLKSDKELIAVEKSSFYAPSLKTPLYFSYPEDSKIYEIERKLLYKYLIDRAIKAGVKIYYKHKVENVVTEKVRNKIIGLIVNGKEVLGDLIIDSAGMFSPVRLNLPECYQIQKELKSGQTFYTFRGLFNLDRTKKIHDEDKFNVYFKFDAIQGIAWYKIVHNLADIIIGSADPMTEEEALQHINKLREYQQSIGMDLVKGGGITTIPIRSTLSRIVGDNYVAIGDSACMTIPINGSGITNSMHAGKILADVILGIDLGGVEKADYSIDKLWDYQVKYYKNIGFSMASIDLIKKCLLSYPTTVLDYFFDNGVIDENDIKAGVLGEEITLGVKELFAKVKAGYKKIPMLLRLNTALSKSKKVKLHSLKIPVVYNESAVKEWCDKYDSYINN